MVLQNVGAGVALDVLGAALVLELLLDVIGAGVPELLLEDVSTGVVLELLLDAALVLLLVEDGIALVLEDEDVGTGIVLDVVGTALARVVEMDTLQLGPAYPASHSHVPSRPRHRP